MARIAGTVAVLRAVPADMGEVRVMARIAGTVAVLRAAPADAGEVR